MRFADWEARLAAYLDSVRLTPFAWGTHDCCLFTAGAVEAMTGVDHMAAFRGRYHTERGAMRLMKRLPGGNAQSTLDGALKRISPSLAQRGDLVLLPDNDRGDSLGICLGKVAIMVGREGDREGLVTLPGPWLDAWAVR